MAVATPARLPVPTRLASDTANAWNDEICFSPECAPDPAPGVFADSPSTRTISRIMRNCTKRVRNVNHTAHPNSNAINR